MSRRDSPMRDCDFPDIMERVVFDPVHGHIELEKPIVALIDTPHFQRLRDLHQLGTSSYVFPGATHTRFDHSLGVAHLAGEMMTSIRRKQPELEIDERDIFYVKAAGLCHDLGHGPFSHVFDGVFIPRVRPELAWKHEDASLMMFDHLVKEFDTGIEKKEQAIIKEFIDCSAEKASLGGTSKEFMYDIVSNGKNGIDVDKFDYLQRDCHFLGMKSSYDGRRLMQMSRIIDNQICYARKDAYNIYQLFQSRYNLHKTVYSHRVAKAVEFMICDALYHADHVMHISKSIYDPEAYMHMTDSILNEIERSKDERLLKSRQIIYRIRIRNLYKMAHEVVLNQDLNSFVPKPIRDTDVASYSDILEPDDVIIHDFNLNYSMRDKNPVEKVKFFNTSEPDRCFHVCRQEVSRMVPEHFSERILRVFLRYPTPAKLEAAEKALDKYIRYHTNGKSREGPSSESGFVRPRSASTSATSFHQVGVSPCPTPPKRKARRTDSAQGTASSSVARDLASELK